MFESETAVAPIWYILFGTAAALAVIGVCWLIASLIGYASQQIKIHNQMSKESDHGNQG